jgi:hypothetical protein
MIIKIEEGWLLVLPSLGEVSQIKQLIDSIYISAEYVIMT